ncbi:heterokaryon incompatibility protein [Xylariales sp. AK1849]|nr:heterokaryon incompatibility protein [Xylariales sp. AK1849]
MMTTSTKSSIFYRRIDPSKEIRLLELHSAPNISDQVDCRLVTARLTKDLDFIAISSLYGEQLEREKTSDGECLAHPGTEKILVNGRPVTITSHLAQALRHVRAVFFPSTSQRGEERLRRPKDSPGWLRQLLKHVASILPDSDLEGQTPIRVWQDFICINQEDEQEKAHELLTLRKVYGSAQLVVGWLGVKMEHTDAAMVALAEIEDSMPPNWGDPGDKEQHPEDYSPTHEWAKKVTHIWADGPDGAISFTLPHWIGCNDFMHRTYFQRRWILEELAMARYPTFLIGDTIVPWKQVLRLNRMMEEFKFHNSEIFPAVKSRITPQNLSLPSQA